MNSLQIFCLFTVVLGINCCGQHTECNDNQKLNPLTDRCVDAAPPSSRPSVWLESCDALPSDCLNYGLDYDLSNLWGGNLECFNGGSAVRCMVKEKPPTTSTPLNKFKYLAYNIFERFYFITVDGQRERTCRIPYWILENIPDVDAIGIQEMFIGGCFENDLSLIDIFNYYGFSYSTAVVDSIFLNGGILIVSKHPIVKKDMHVYQNTYGVDSFVAKGVSYAKVEKSAGGQKKNYHLFSSHLQSGGGNDNSVRNKQCREWGIFTSSLNIPSHEPIIYGGDLNLRSDEYQLCLNLMSASMPGYSPNSIQTSTWDPKTNTILKINNSGRNVNLIDYVFYNKHHQLPVSAFQLILNAKTDEFSVSYAEEIYSIFRHSHQPIFDCKYKIERIKDISDHYPVLGDFTF